MDQKIKGRGTGLNPKNRFERFFIEDFNDDDMGDFQSEKNLKPLTQYFKDESKSVIAINKSEDLGFDYSFNPYRGCEHGCVYCYARPTHEFLGFSSGLDFETKIMIKDDAPKLLEREFQKKSYKTDVIIFSGNTDCYQPAEKKLEITREALKICLKYRNPVAIITKNALVQRDIDILKEMNKFNLISVTLSITSLDRSLIRKMEPRTSTPEKRFETIKILSEANIPVGVNIAPVIPGLNDEEIPDILKEASSNGASFAGCILLRLPYSVKDLFVKWLGEEFPDRKDKVINRIKNIRGGKLNHSEFGKRFSGEGEFAETIHKLFKLSCNKYNLNKNRFDLSIEYFRKQLTNQIDLFA